MGFPGGLVVKNPTAGAGDRGFDPLGLKDPLKEEMTAHSSFLASEILWTEKPGGLQSMETQKVTHSNRACRQRHTRTHTHTHISCMFQKQYVMQKK